MTQTTSQPEGGCSCRQLRYRLQYRPERDDRDPDRVELLVGAADVVDTPSASGKGQKISRCPSCRVAVWSNYAGAGDSVRFVRVGTLDDPAPFPLDIHIFTASKQAWVVLGEVPAMAQPYRAVEYWPRESLERKTALQARVQQLALAPGSPGR